jgi:hypothetical protein
MSTAFRAVVVIGLLISGAATTSAKTDWLTAAELKSVFSAQTVNGEYPGGQTFSEVYGADGSIRYSEPHRTSGGKWSIKGDAFCTFYDSPGMAGACFKVTRASVNCLQYHVISGSAATGAKMLDPRQQWDARGSIAGRAGKCGDASSV